MAALVIYVQLQKVELDSAAGDLTFGTDIALFKGNLYASSDGLSNGSGAVFRVSKDKLEKEFGEFGRIGQHLGYSMFSDGYTMTVVSRGTITKDKRETNGLVTLNGAYNGELVGFTFEPKDAITIKDQTFVAVDTSVYVFTHVTSTTSYLSYIFEARVESKLDGYGDKICWVTAGECTILTRMAGEDTWEKTSGFSTPATQVFLTTFGMYGVSDGKLYAYNVSKDGQTVTSTVHDTGKRGPTVLSMLSDRSIPVVAVEVDSTSIHVFSFVEDAFKYSGICTQSGLIDIEPLTSKSVVVSASNDLFRVNLV